MGISENSIKALAKAREERKNSGIKIKVKDPLQKSRENPNSLRISINAKCWDCQGAGFDPGCKEAIRDCLDTDCPLHAVRPYQRKA